MTPPTNATKGAVITFVNAIFALVIGLELISPEVAALIVGIIDAGFLVFFTLVPGTPLHFTRSPKRLPDAG